MHEHLLAKNYDTKKFILYMIKFMRMSEIFDLDKTEIYENSLIGYLFKGNVSINFFKTKEWFYATWGKVTIRRRRFDLFIKYIGKIFKKKRDEFFKILGNRVLTGVKGFLNKLGLPILDAINFSKWKKINIKLHKLFRITYYKGKILITFSKYVSNEIMEKIKLYIKNNFSKLAGIKYEHITVIQLNSPMRLFPSLDELKKFKLI